MSIRSPALLVLACAGVAVAASAATRALLDPPRTETASSSGALEARLRELGDELARAQQVRVQGLALFPDSPELRRLAGQEP